MKRFLLRGTLESPVAIKRNRQSERSESVRSVPGTLVRGALAAAYLHHHGEADATFHRLFRDDGGCRFGPLDPAPQIFPLTAAACKREQADHALVDQAWLRVAQYWASDPLTESVLRPWRRCDSCGADLKSYSGFWSDESGVCRPATRDRHAVAAHVGIDRHTTTAAESIFYSLEAMMPSGNGVDLWGWLAVDEPLVEALEELLDLEQHSISVGHHLSRGYGRVKLELQPADEALESWSESWDEWSRELVQFLGQIAPACQTSLDPDQDFFFSLTFPTGAILVDEVLRYTFDPAALVAWLPPLDELAQNDSHAQQLPPTAEVPLRTVAAVTRHERVRGWNVAHGLPRQDEWAVARGAVYVYWFHGAAEQRNHLKEQLCQLARQGIGLRRNEGFGWIHVSDDFHRRFSHQESLS